MIPREKLCLALDSTHRARLLALARDLRPLVGWLKVGSIPWTAFGPDFLRELGQDCPIFLDLKFHDIPHTVGGAVTEAAKRGVGLLTIHAAGGEAMIAAAADAARKSGTTMKVVAVTVLTHLEGRDLERQGVARSLEEQTEALARLAMGAGADGVVCSPRETARLRAALGPKALLVVPGVRPAWAQAGDQKRIDTPEAALAAGADILVVGRPILDAPDPVDAARRIRAGE